MPTTVTTPAPTTTPAVTTARPPTTTPEECSDNLDDYEPVTVTREESDKGLLVPAEEWWHPKDPPRDVRFPYEGSHLTVGFDVQTRLTSVIVLTNHEKAEAVQISLKIQLSVPQPYIPWEDPTSDSYVFVGKTGNRIRLPPSTPYITGIQVWLIAPYAPAGYQVIFNGCEVRGQSCPGGMAPKPNFMKLFSKTKNFLNKFYC